MQEFGREERVGAEIHRELALLLRDEARDPRLAKAGGAMEGCLAIAWGAVGWCACLQEEPCDLNVLLMFDRRLKRASLR